MLGVGAWFRVAQDMKPEDAAKHLDYMVIPLHTGRAGPINRGPTVRTWCKTFKDLGGILYAMDWLPIAALNPVYLGETCDYARELGCIGVMVDAEPDSGWRDAVLEAKRYTKTLTEAAGLDLETSVTDYGRGGMSAETHRVFLEALSVGVPQSYDPGGKYLDTYHTKSVKYWRDRGAQDVVLGVSLWLASQKRHRTGAEFSQHTSNLPVDINGVCVWYGSGQGNRHRRLAEVLPILSNLRARFIKDRTFDRSRIRDLAEDALQAGDEAAYDVLTHAAKDAAKD